MRHGRLAALLACWGIVLAFTGGSAHAAEFPPILDPVLSLTGDCSVSPLDAVPDPGCPYLPPPSGPTPKFDQPRAIAVDGFGNEYVASFAEGEPSGRIDVFDDEGRFLTEFSAPNAVKIVVDGEGNVYVLEGTGGVVRYAPAAGYDPEAGEIQYTAAPMVISGTSLAEGIAVDAANDHLLISQLGSVQIFASAAEGNVPLETLTTESTGGKIRGWSQGITVDGQRRRIYVVYCANGISECGVLVLGADAPHAFIGELDGSSTPGGKFSSGQGRISIAVNEETGDFFVDDVINTTLRRVYGFDEGLNYKSQLGSSGFAGNGAIQIAVSNGETASGDAANRGYLFVPTFQNNTALAFEPPGVLAPEIASASATHIGETEAELAASIDPEGAATHWQLQYTTTQAFEEEEFASAQVAAEGTIPGSAQDTALSRFIAALAPGTSYRFRAVAENEAGKDEATGAFSTYSDAPAGGECPNATLRTGPSAALPDCRAYELVTPPETNGRAPRTRAAAGDFFPSPLASPSGGAFSFLIEGGSLPGTNGSGGYRGDAYLATRTPGGWSSELSGPSGEFAPVETPASASPDQGYSFWIARVEGPAVIEGKETHYLRYPDGHSELLGSGSIGTDPTARGKLISSGGTHVVFQTSAFSGSVPQQLEPDAPPTGTVAVYDRTPDEATHVVSLLPGNLTPAAGQNATYLGASADGEGIAFSIGSTLYLRKQDTTTYEIGSGVTFAGVSEGGERLFYLQGGDLYAYDTETEEAIRFSETGDAVPVNVASEGTRAYFLSETAIAGSGQNPRGGEAAAGKENLYLSAEGAVSFIATVTDRDAEGEENPLGGSFFDGLGLWTRAQANSPASDPSRTNPAGSVLLFQSRANLTGYDPQNESPEIYRYDASAGSLSCISCIPTGAPATGGASLQTISFFQGSPPPLATSDLIANLTPDGSRAFFESTEALVSRDTDGVQDVYEWEADETGSCTRPGGCVYLISSGRADRDQFLFAHSRDGKDVFYTTSDVLTWQDPSNTPSVYDARIGGGFAQTGRPGECLGEACQPAASPPVEATPASAAFHGSGNVKPTPTAHSCPRAKRRVKGRCVNKHRHTHRKSKRNRAGGSTK